MSRSKNSLWSKGLSELYKSETVLPGSNYQIIGQTELHVKQTKRLYSKTCVKQLLSKRSTIGFQEQLSLDAGQTEHSALLSAFIKLLFVSKTFVSSIFEWLFYTGFTVIVCFNM